MSGLPSGSCRRTRFDQRFASVDDVADFCVFLCSERVGYAVGDAFHVDGGMLRAVK